MLVNEKFAKMQTMIVKYGEKISYMALLLH